jgi:hypothetical protein
MKVRTQRVLLRSAARTATTATPQTEEYTMHGGRAYLAVSAASGTGGLTLQWRGYDKASGNTAIIMLAPTAITGAGIYVYELLAGYSSAVEGDVKHSISRGLPVQWDINIVHGDSSSYTYSLSVETF